MPDEKDINRHEGLELWDSQYTQASSSPEWATLTMERKRALLLGIMKKFVSGLDSHAGRKYVIPNDDQEALGLAERIILSYERV